MTSAKGYCASALMSLNVIMSLTDPEIAHLTHIPPHSPAVSQANCFVKTSRAATSIKHCQHKEITTV